MHEGKLQANIEPFGGALFEQPCKCSSYANLYFKHSVQFVMYLSSSYSIWVNLLEERLKELKEDSRRPHQCHPMHENSSSWDDSAWVGSFTELQLRRPLRPYLRGSRWHTCDKWVNNYLHWYEHTRIIANTCTICIVHGKFHIGYSQEMQTKLSEQVASFWCPWNDFL